MYQEAAGKSRWSLDKCIMFHLLTRFSSTAAEDKKFYLTNTVKKPTCCNVRQYVQRVEQLNGYLPLLPNNSEGNTKKMKAVKDKELASLILWSVHNQWQDQ